MRLRKNQQQKTFLQKTVKAVFALIGLLLFVGFVGWLFRRSELT